LKPNETSNLFLFFIFKKKFKAYHEGIGFPKETGIFVVRFFSEIDL